MNPACADPDLPASAAPAASAASDDACCLAAIAVDAALRVHAVNERALPLLRAPGAALHVQQGSLRAVGADADANLRRLVSRAFAQPGTTQALSIARAAAPPLTLRLRTWPGQDRAWLRLRDPQQVHVDMAVVQALWGLTAAEARVVAALCGGHDTTQIARLVGVQPNTVVSHLKKALSKTDTRRQAELVALVLRSVAAGD